MKFYRKIAWCWEHFGFGFNLCINPISINIMLGFIVMIMTYRKPFIIPLLEDYQEIVPYR